MLNRGGYIFVGCLIFFCVSSCDSYQKILKSTDLDLKYEKAVEYYEKDDFYKALPLFEELISVQRGSKNVEKIYYYYCYCHYGLNDFLLASFHFKNFTRTYSNSEYAEECQFMNAYCQYLMSPDKNLDQSFTSKAMLAFQLFINMYPQSERVAECNDYIDQLRHKIQAKDYAGAKLYYELGYFKAAYTALAGLLVEYPDIPNKEEIRYYILRSHFRYAMNSVKEKKQERFDAAIKAYNTLVMKHPNGEFKKAADNIYETISKNLIKLN